MSGDVLERAKAWKASIERPGAPRHQYVGAAFALIPELIAEIERLREQL